MNTATRDPKHTASQRTLSRWWKLAIILGLALVAGCRADETNDFADLARTSGASSPEHVLIVASRDNHADLNIILTFTKERGFVLQTLQRDYAVYSNIIGCKREAKLTDNLAAYNGNVAKYKQCVEGMMNAYYSALRNTTGNGRNEQLMRLGANTPFRIQQVFHVQLT